MSQQRPEDASGNQNNPPSFAPSNRRKNMNGSFSHNASSNNGNAIPSFPPKQNHKFKEVENQNSQINQKAPSFAPTSRRNGNISHPKISNTTPSINVQPISTAYSNSESHTISPDSYIGTSNEIFEKPDDVESIDNSANNPIGYRKKHHFLKYLTLLLVTLLIIVGVCGALSWNWVDSQIKREPWLTNTEDTQETTWLILGSDQREGEEAKEITGFRTDTILVLTKPVSGHSSLISIPRDSLVSINGQQMKINTVAQDIGKRALTKTVEKITGHKIDHVAEIKFEGLTKVVNSLGGIDLCYNRTVNDAYSGLNWTAGCHSVDGTVALAFSRMRYADPQSDFGRAARQRMVISAIMKKALSSSTLTNFGTVKGFAKASLDSAMLDENTNPGTLLNMGLAFKEATGKDGVTGTVYWTNPDYEVYGVGSSVLLDDAKNIELFNQLSAGTHAPGSVGTLAELMNQQ